MQKHQMKKGTQKDESNKSRQQNGELERNLLKCHRVQYTTATTYEL